MITSRNVAAFAAVYVAPEGETITLSFKVGGDRVDTTVEAKDGFKSVGYSPIRPEAKMTPALAAAYANTAYDRYRFERGTLNRDLQEERWDAVR